MKQRLPQIETYTSTVYDLEKAATLVNHVLTRCAVDAAPRRQRRDRKAKLRVWTSEIKTVIAGKKDAFDCWKIAGRLQDRGNQLLIQ